MSGGGESESQLLDRAVGNERAAAALAFVSGCGLVVAVASWLAPSLLPRWVHCGGPYLVAAYVLVVALGAWAGAGPLWAAVAVLPSLVAGPTVLSATWPFIVSLLIALSFGVGVGLRRAIPLTTRARRVAAVGAYVAVVLTVAVAISWVLNLGSGSYEGPPQVELSGTYHPGNRTLTVRHVGGMVIENGRVTVWSNGSRRGTRLAANRTNTTGVWYDADAPAAATAPLSYGDAVHVRDVGPATTVRVVWSGRTDSCSPLRSGVLWGRDTGG